MKRSPHFTKCLLPAVLLLVTGLILLPPGSSKLPDRSRMDEVNNNPDKFHLVATNSAYDYSFIYDPLAADEWLFHTGGPAQTNLHPK